MANELAKPDDDTGELAKWRYKRALLKQQLGYWNEIVEYIVWKAIGLSATVVGGLVRSHAQGVLRSFSYT